MKVACLVVATFLSGCLVPGPYEQSVRDSPSHQRDQDPQALRLVTDSYGVTGADVAYFMHWVDSPIPRQDGTAGLWGVTFTDFWPHCDSWFVWEKFPGSPDAATTYSNTAFAHELGHCASMVLRPDLDSDPDHTDPDMWGPGGAVERAYQALRDVGL